MEVGNCVESRIALNVVVVPSLDATDVRSFEHGRSFCHHFGEGVAKLRFDVVVVA